MAREEVQEVVKTCRTCNIEKLDSEFHRHRGKARAECKVCFAEYRRLHYLANREHTLLVNRAWAQRNPENVKRRSAEWFAANTARHHALTAARYVRHREIVRAEHKVWYETNKVSRNETIRAWQAANPEAVKAIRKRYARNHPDKLLANSAMNRAYRGRAAPPWLTKEHKSQIRKFYTIARWIFAETGLPHHVDHIVPIRGRNVCGLHVPWNLQLLSASDNRRKHNKFEG